MNSESNLTVGEKGNTSPIQGRVTPHEKYDYTKETSQSLGVTENKEEKPIDPERGNSLMLCGDDLRFLATLGSDVYTQVIVALFEWYTKTKATLELVDPSRILFFKTLLNWHLRQSAKYAQRCKSNRANGAKKGTKKQADSTPKQPPQS